MVRFKLICARLVQISSKLEKTGPHCEVFECPSVRIQRASKAFKFGTILIPNRGWPFELHTSPVFRWSLCVCSKFFCTRKKSFDCVSNLSTLVMCCTIKILYNIEIQRRVTNVKILLLLYKWFIRSYINSIVIITTHYTSPILLTISRMHFANSVTYNKYMLTLFSGCPFPGVRCLRSIDLCLIARETARYSWTWVCIIVLDVKPLISLLIKVCQ